MVYGSLLYTGVPTWNLIENRFSIPLSVHYGDSHHDYRHLAVSSQVILQACVLALLAMQRPSSEQEKDAAISSR